jgi:Helix-turn-helix.
MPKQLFLNGHETRTERNTPRKVQDKSQDPHSLTKAMRNQIMNKRVKLGYTQAEIAKAAGVGKATVNLFENGTVNIGTDKMVRICISLGIQTIKIY